MNLLFLGAPGSGKGTQSVRVADRCGLVHLSTGRILREAINAETELGVKARSYMDKGELVPDSVLIEIIEKEIDSGKLEDGFIMDGFPRTMPQAVDLKQILFKKNISLDKAILLAVSDEEVIKRLSGRWLCPKCKAGYNYPARLPKVEGRCDDDNEVLERRPDDEEDVVLKRLEIYKEQTMPIIDFYRSESILTEIEGQRQPDQVFSAILDVLETN